MMMALELAAQRVRPGGSLYLAIYNDQGRMSVIWRMIKKTYCSAPKTLQCLLLFLCLIRVWGPTVLRDTCRLKPLKTWQYYVRARGMSPWHDVVDWVGGYPFEVAKPELIFQFYRDRGFTLQALKTCAGGLGCNEFLFKYAE
jgi:2-polyprenyl-6-hydroxyphenyl methylase/3-demethylubiquinone-9 3-methyltransferase